MVKLLPLLFALFMGSAQAATTIPEWQYDQSGGNLNVKDNSGTFVTMCALSSVTHLCVVPANNLPTTIAGSQTANLVFASPNGSSGNPAFRSIVANDLPSVSGLNGSATCSQLPALTGNVTTSAGSCGTTIAAGVVTSGMMVAGAATSNIGSQIANTVYAAPNGASGNNANRALVTADIPTGTSGAVIGLLNGNLTFGGSDTFSSVPSLPSQIASVVFASPTGSSGTPSFRHLVSADVTGTTTNDNAAAGIVGEYVASSIASGSAVSLTSTINANVTSISLTAGDWDCRGAVQNNPSGTTTTTFLYGGISTTSATIPGLSDTGPRGQAGDGVASTAGSPEVVTIPTGRFSLASTTTVYLVAQSVFSVSTSAAFGFISCRRVR